MNKQVVWSFGEKRGLPWCILEICENLTTGEEGSLKHMGIRKDCVDICFFSIRDFCRRQKCL